MNGLPRTNHTPCGPAGESGWEDMPAMPATPKDAHRCLLEVIIKYASGRINELCIYYELGLIARSAGSVASAFIDGVLHRETSHWNRN